MNIRELFNDKQLKNKEDLAIDDELDSVIKYAMAHYPGAKSKQLAFMKFVQRSLAHSKEDDSLLKVEVAKIKKSISRLEQEVDKIKNQPKTSPIPPTPALKETGVKKLSKVAQNSLKGAITTPDANNNAGDAYKSYRFGLALAGAPDYPTKAVNDIGGDPLITTYTDAERDMIMYAAKQSDVGRLKSITSNKSAEMPDTNTKSPVAARKKNRYGV